MRLFRIEEYVKAANPTPGKFYRPEILTHRDGAKNLNGIFAILVPGSEVPYHYHRDRESVIIGIAGEATEVLEGKEIPIEAGDILYIPPGEKHGTVNRSGRDFRYLEFFTSPPLTADFIEVK